MFERILAFAQRVLAVMSIVAVVALFAFIEGCRTSRPSERDVRGWRRSVVSMEVTGYDSGPRSCNWKRNWFGRPVIASGPNKGKPKAVGITASGSRAKRGTIAADKRIYPFGTVMYVPGYGWGTVEDTGGAIKGPARIDLWFSSEREALKWGRRRNVSVTVWTKP